MVAQHGHTPFFRARTLLPSSKSGRSASRSTDGQPILGRAHNWQNVTLAVGHGSTGILLSPITGKCIAELIATEKEAGVDPGVWG